MTLLTSLRVAGYRSLRDICLPLSPLTVVVGENGTGKTNLYRSVYLLHAAASGGLARVMAEEGGMPSALWAGPRKKGPVRLVLGLEFDDGLGYELEAGLPEPNDLPSSFKLDPLIKSETVTFGGATLVDRGKSGAMLRDASGARVNFPLTLSRSESVLTQLQEPHRFPTASALRERLIGWRFYHGFRADAESPVRQPQVGVFTPALAHDGMDLAAALQTILEIGDFDGLHRAVRQGLNGARLEIVCPDGSETRFRIQLHTPGLLRPLEAWEFSDGTLRYLCLLAALLSPRPPALLALNEPESSLHPNLLPALATRIVEASRNGQVWVVTHSGPLAEEIERLSGTSPLQLKKANGETCLA